MELRIKFQISIKTSSTEAAAGMGEITRRVDNLKTSRVESSRDGFKKIEMEYFFQGQLYTPRLED